MSYLKFDKSKLVNLEYSLNKEILRTNRAGAYACTTIVGCNTRKYHGLLVCPLDQFDGEKHVLLSSLDETVVQHNAEFNLGIHKYPGDNYYPKGHKYIRDFECEQLPKTVYQVGGAVVSKERVLVENEDQILIKYTLEEAHSPTKLLFRPILAFREMHRLNRANLFANTKVSKIENGVKSRMYDGYPYLHMQLSKANEFVQIPDWNYNIEYMCELERGYDYQEDLFVPGYFEVDIKKGESIIFSAGTTLAKPAGLKKKFEVESKKRVARDNFEDCLKNSAQQFIVTHNKKTDIIAGYPWFGSWGRDTFIALPGLTLAADDPKSCKDVIDSMIKKMKGGLFPNMGSDENPAFNSIDAPLWFFWSIQQYANYTNTKDTTWKNYGKAMKNVLEAYEKGASFNIKMHDNGLIYGGENGKALTWMDAVVYGKAITPRIGYNVEINALWYNAIMFSIEMAKLAEDNTFVKKWEKTAKKTKESYLSAFWDEKKGYLADYIDLENKNWDVRPNMVIATSLEYTPITNDIKKAVLATVKSELLTPRGLRTLSPKNEDYVGEYKGNQAQRDGCYHQGTVWPWLVEHYATGLVNLYKKSAIPELKKIYNGFEEVMTEHGISTISEIYDGNPPHHPRGTISQAWSVSALLQIKKLIENHS